MDCKLDKNLTGECKYAISGIHSLWVLNIDDFQVYEFRDDKLYSEIYIDNIYIKGNGTNYRLLTNPSLLKSLRMVATHKNLQLIYQSLIQKYRLKY